MYHPDKFLLACILFAIASFECLIIYPASNESEAEEDEVEKPPKKKSGRKKKMAPKEDKVGFYFIISNCTN